MVGYASEVWIGVKAKRGGRVQLGEQMSLKSNRIPESYQYLRFQLEYLGISEFESGSLIHETHVSPQCFPTRM
jgi:hypothetical protein